MGKTTKGTQAASLEPLRKIKPNVASSTPGGAEGSGTPAPLLFDGRPEQVPELTFVVERRQANDDFINGANTYHTNCGLQPQTIRSIEHLVDLLAAANTPLRRIRIVTHAHPTNMAVALFEGSTVFHAEKAYLRGFAQDDIAGIYALLGLARGQHFLTWNLGTILAHIRSGTPNVLTPFGLGSSGSPPMALRDYMLFCSDYFFANANGVKKNGLNLPAAEKTHLLNALSVVIAQTGAPLMGTSMAGHLVGQADLDALRALITGMTLADFGFGSGSFNFTIPAAGTNPFPLVGRAVAAIQNDFRTKLNQVRQRFNATSVIDIRGCRAGQDTDYLQAVREFFGAGTALPQVTAPRWFQYFGPSGFADPANNTQIRNRLQTGAAAAETRAGFEDWAKRVQVDPGHKIFWLNLLNRSVVRFSLLEWRTTLPPLPLPTPGLTAFAALGFGDAIAKIRDFFNVPAASTPTGASLNTIASFVSGSLMGYAPNLLAPLNGATPATRLQELYQGLRAINQDLGQALVPATAPTPLQASHITSYQTALVGYIENTQLAPIRTFMTAARQRLEDPSDPGLYYYMLHAGLPVFVFSHRESVNAHVVTVTHNTLMVLQAYADVAYRQWPPLLWASPLPPGNPLGSLQGSGANARRFAMMVEDADGGSTQVAACPHPDYLDKIATVP